ncbi:hypothetical protein ABIF91_001744 [Bradyrhizobium sp. USDA 241]
MALALAAIDRGLPPMKPGPEDYKAWEEREKATKGETDEVE